MGQMIPVGKTAMIVAAVGATIILVAEIAIISFGMPKTESVQKTEVMDSLHVTNCDRGYIITPDGKVFHDKDGRKVPCD